LQGGQFQPYVLVALVGGLLMAAGWLVFLYHLIATIGLKNVLGLFVPERWLARKQAASAPA